MTPEEVEKKKEEIKAKKAGLEEEHQKSRQTMAEAKKEVDDLIAKAKAVKRKP